MTRNTKLPRICETCGASFLGWTNKRFCPSCREERGRQHRLEYMERKRRGLTRKLGTIDRCIVCGAEYTVTSGLQCYCHQCAPAAYMAKDAQSGLAYYNERKETINPVRNQIRNTRRIKKMTVCVVCGKEIAKAVNVKTCPDCREEYHKTRLVRVKAERSAQKLAKRGGKPYHWQEAELATLQEMLAQGRETAEIARALGRSHEGVSIKMRKMGIRRRSLPKNSQSE